MKKILIVAPHPDDEVLGCGGTILNHIAAGDQVAWLIVTNIFEEHGFSKEVVEGRQKEIEKVEQMFNFSKTYKLDFPTATLSSNIQPQLISAISQVMQEFMPDTVYVPFLNDVHSDHYYSFQATLACTKSFRYPFVKKILMYETLSETDFSAPLPNNAFQANVFVDISSYLERKIEIMNIYESEVAPHPFPRSIENIRALAHLRGATAGCMAAESFVLIKEIVD